MQNMLLVPCVEKREACKAELKFLSYSCYRRDVDCFERAFMFVYVLVTSGKVSIYFSKQTKIVVTFFLIIVTALPTNCYI